MPVEMRSDRYVIIHIWRPRTDGNFGSAAQVAYGGGAGHVSVSLIDKQKSLYQHISFWPTKAKNSGNFWGVFQKYYSHDSTLITDFRSMGKPDERVILYGLDIENIHAAYKKLLSMHQREQLVWQAIKNRPNTKKEIFINEQNCAYMSWALLVNGDIHQYPLRRAGIVDPELRKQYSNGNNNIFKGLFNSFFWRDWIITPMFVLHLSSSAKEQELKRYPETKLWSNALRERALELFLMRNEALFSPLINPEVSPPQDNLDEEWGSSSTFYRRVMPAQPPRATEDKSIDALTLE